MERRAKRRGGEGRRGEERGSRSARAAYGRTDGQTYVLRACLCISLCHSLLTTRPTQKQFKNTNHERTRKLTKNKRNQNQKPTKTPVRAFMRFAGRVDEEGHHVSLADGHGGDRQHDWRVPRRGQAAHGGGTYITNRGGRGVVGAGTVHRHTCVRCAQHWTHQGYIRRPRTKGLAAGRML